MKLWPAALATFGVSVVVVTGGAAFLVNGGAEEVVHSDPQVMDDSDQTLPPTPNFTPSPPSPAFLGGTEPSTGFQPGVPSLPTIFIKGKEVRLPDGFMVVTYSEDIDVMGVRRGNSSVMWTPDGVVVEKIVDTDDEAALAEILAVLEE